MIGALVFLLILAGIGFVFFKGATWFVSSIDGNRSEGNYSDVKANTSVFKKHSPVDFSIAYVSDSVAQINLANEVAFNWNLRTNEIIEDSLLAHLVRDYPDRRNRIVDLILDTTQTEIRICTMSHNAVRGDFAFLLADRIVNFPYLDLFHVQWDTFEMGCIYPDGLLDYVGKHRIEIQQRIAEYRP